MFGGENMGTPERKGLNIFNGRPYVGKRNPPVVEIYPDGTACEDQPVPAGTPCIWVGFDKTKGVGGVVYGAPVENSES